MTGLDDLQARFMRYLQYADNAIAQDIVGEAEGQRERRMSIYFNAYRIRLRGSIEIDHPVLSVYLGDEGFERLAAAYISRHPSSETSLRHFCDALPRFLQDEEPYRHKGELFEIATFERLLMEVFDAADANAVSIDVLSNLEMDQWPALQFAFHPGIRLYVTPWNSVEIWQALHANNTPPPAQEVTTQAWLLWRNRESLTEFRSLPVDEYEVLKLALSGASFASLCEALLEWHDEAAVASRAMALLNAWFSAGIVISG